MPWTETHEALFQKLNQNLDEYQRQMWSMTGIQVYALANEIAATRLCYDQIVGDLGNWPVEDLEYLLRFKDPLAVVRDQWMAEQDIDHSESIGHTLWELRDKCAAEMDYELDPSWKPEQDTSGSINMC